MMHFVGECCEGICVCLACQCNFMCILLTSVEVALDCTHCCFIMFGAVQCSSACSDCDRPHVVRLCAELEQHRFALQS
jgi:hypothetical protein